MTNELIVLNDVHSYGTGFDWCVSKKAGGIKGLWDIPVVSRDLERSHADGSVKGPDSMSVLPVTVALVTSTTTPDLVDEPQKACQVLVNDLRDAWRPLGAGLVCALRIDLAGVSYDMIGAPKGATVDMENSNVGVALAICTFFVYDGPDSITVTVS